MNNSGEIINSLPPKEVDAPKDVILSEWLLFLETDNKEVLEVLAKKNKEIGKAYSVLDAMSKNKEARQLYEAREALLHDQATWLEESYDKGREEGRVAEAFLIAKALKAKGMTNQDIAEVTGLSLTQVENLS